MSVGHITQIQIFPVKGEPGRNLTEAAVESEGLAGDRRKKAAVHVVAGEESEGVRANFVVDLTPDALASSVGRTLVLGEVELDVTRSAGDCPGVYASVRLPGTVHLGDAVL